MIKMAPLLVYFITIYGYCKQKNRFVGIANLGGETIIFFIKKDNFAQISGFYTKT